MYQQNSEHGKQEITYERSGSSVVLGDALPEEQHHERQGRKLRAIEDESIVVVENKGENARAAERACEKFDQRNDGQERGYKSTEKGIGKMPFQPREVAVPVHGLVDGTL